MAQEIINCESYLNNEMRYYVKFVIDVRLTKGQVYKEDLHRNIYDVIGRMVPDVQSDYILQVFNNANDQGSTITFGYQSFDQGGFGMVECIQIEDNHFFLEYAEFRRDNLGLPNLKNALLPYICLLEALMVGQGEGNTIKAVVDNKVSTTMRAAYAYQTSPFVVESSPTLTYYANDQTSLTSQIERDGLVYQAIRRFYQQFKSERLCNLPNLNLQEEAFDEGYGKIWK